MNEEAEKFLFKSERILFREDGSLEIRSGDYSRRASLDAWESMANESLLLRSEVERLRREVNERQPNKFLALLLKDLDALESQSRSIASPEGAGLVLMGQAQGIREAIQCIKKYLPDFEKYTQF